MHTLIAKTSAFADTFHDPIESDFLIVRSEDLKKIEEIEKILSDRNSDIMQYFCKLENDDNFWRIKCEDEDNLYYMLKTSFGLVQIRWFPVDRFYGAGCLNYFTIESDPEFAYIPPIV